MKYSKKAILPIILAILFIASFAFPSPTSTEIGEMVSRVYTKNGQEASSTASTSPLVVEKEISAVTMEEVLRQRDVKLSSLVRKNIVGSYVTQDQYGIVEDGPDVHLVVDVSQLLPKTNWKDYPLGQNGLNFKYPSTGWFVQKKAPSMFIMTTTRSGLPEEGKPWAKITIGEYSRGGKVSLLDWMKINGTMYGENVPPSDRTTQYVTIGQSIFLGSIFFKDNIWFGKKNVYAEVSPTYIFAGTLEVANLTAFSPTLGKFDQVFYTMMETLEIKQPQWNE
jgi:hypothetical protein